MKTEIKLKLIIKILLSVSKDQRRSKNKKKNFVKRNKNMLNFLRINKYKNIKLYQKK